MKAALLGLMVMGSIFGANASEIELVRKHSKSACYVFEKSVYFTYLNEEVGGRDHLYFNDEISSLEEIKLAILEAKNGAVVIPNGKFEMARLSGDMAVLENGSVVLLNSEKLSRFMDLNCRGE